MNVSLITHFIQELERLMFQALSYKELTSTINKVKQVLNPSFSINRLNKSNLGIR